MKNDRFKLEQLIMRVWGTDEDLETLLAMMDDPDKTPDQIRNLLTGIIELHRCKSEALFECFEDMVHTRKM